MKKEKKPEIWASVLREVNNDDRPKCPLYEDSKQPVQPPIYYFLHLSLETEQFSARSMVMLLLFRAYPQRTL